MTKQKGTLQMKKFLLTILVSFICSMAAEAMHDQDQVATVTVKVETQPSDLADANKPTILLADESHKASLLVNHEDFGKPLKFPFSKATPTIHAKCLASIMDRPSFHALKDGGYYVLSIKYVQNANPHRNTKHSCSARWEEVHPEGV